MNQEPKMMCIPVLPKPTEVPKDLQWLVNQVNESVDLDNLEKQASGIVVSDETSARNALSMSLQARKIRQQLELSRKEIVKPHFDYQRDVGKIVADAKDRLEQIESTLQQRISDYMKSQEDNPFSCVNEIEVEDGKISAKKKWAFSIVCEELVPEEYLCVDTAKVEKAIANGVRQISGITIFEDQTYTMRVKN
jgi:hypothetical protein